MFIYYLSKHTLIYSCYDDIRSSKFIINCDKFKDAVNKKFNIGSRFTMKFEGCDFKEIW